MQSTTTQEATMLGTHLTRLTVLVITGSILVAAYAQVALAGASARF